MRTLVTQMAVEACSVNEIARALIKAGYIDARPSPPARQNPLATHGRTILWVKLGRTQCELFPALPQLGHCSMIRHVSKAQADNTAGLPEVLSTLLTPITIDAPQRYLAIAALRTG